MFSLGNVSTFSKIKLGTFANNAAATKVVDKSFLQVPSMQGFVMRVHSVTADHSSLNACAERR
jgi:hypothetical protein